MTHKIFSHYKYYSVKLTKTHATQFEKIKYDRKKQEIISGRKTDHAGRDDEK